MQYERNDTNLVRGKFRVRGDTIEVHPAYEEFAVRVELFGDEIERITTVDTLTGEQLSDLDELVIFPATALRRRRGADAARRSRVSRPSSRSGWPGSRRRESCSRRSAFGCGRRTTWRCWRKWASARASRTTAATSTDAPQASRPTPCSTSSRRTICWSSTSRTRRSRSCTASIRETAPARRPSSSTGSGCPRRQTTALCASTSSTSGSTSASSCRPPRRLTRSSSRPKSSSRSCGRPGWWTPRSSSSRPRARSTT